MNIGYLLTASCIWAFSFGIIGNVLQGVPALFSAEIRLFFAAVVFLPFLRRVRMIDILVLMALGAVQFGAMSFFYMSSFAYLPSHEVALFTVMTPVYVSLLNDVHEKKFHGRNLAAAALAVTGAGIILWKPDLCLRRSLTGFLFVEASNLCFAIGQTGYRFWMRRSGAPKADHCVFFWLMSGGAIALGLPFLSVCVSAPPVLSMRAWLVLFYLGVVVSGGSYYLWNKGARSVAPGILAVMNNVKVPLGVAVSLLVFGEKTKLLPLLAGGMLILLAILPGVFPLRKRREGEDRN